jgi:hypothetical protein
MQWTHTIYVEVSDGPEDWKEVECRLRVEGTKGRPMSFNAAWGNWEPPEEPELDLIECKIKDGDKWRKPVPSSYPDNFDQEVIDAIDGWWADRSEECWESLEEYGE